MGARNDERRIDRRDDKWWVYDIGAGYGVGLRERRLGTRHDDGVDGRHDERRVHLTSAGFGLGLRQWRLGSRHRLDGRYEQLRDTITGHELGLRQRRLGAGHEQLHDGITGRGVDLRERRVGAGHHDFGEHLHDAIAWRRLGLCERRLDAGYHNLIERQLHDAVAWLGMGVRQWRLGAGHEQLQYGIAGFRMDVRERRLAASGHGDDLQHAYYDFFGRVHDAGSVHRDRRWRLRERRLAPAELAETSFSVAPSGSEGREPTGVPPGGCRRMR
jgi:hypothetical protein